MFMHYTASSSLLQIFRKIRTDEYNRIIHFYALYEKEIITLDAEEYLTILSYYINALFEVGGYELEVIKQSSILLECSIVENIQYIDGQDIYMRALLQKAISLMHIDRKDEGLHIAKQLYALAPFNKTYKRFYKDCLILTRPKWIIYSFRASIGFMLSAIVIKIIGFILALGSIENILLMSVFILSSLCSLACLYGLYQYVHKPLQAVTKAKKEPFDAV